MSRIGTALAAADDPGGRALQLESIALAREHGLDGGRWPWPASRVANDRTVEIDLLADPSRLRELDVTVLDA